jgi:hypothetical protein
MISSSLNISKLRKIAHESDESEAIFECLKNRDRTRKVTDLRQLQYKLLDDGAKLTKEGVMRVFQQLQDEGIGSLIIGRKGNPTRFKWNYSIKKIGKIGLSRKKVKTQEYQNDSNSSVTDIRQQINQVIPSHVRQATKDNKIKAYMITDIQLRNDVVAKLELPIDITKSEAKKIHDFILTLIYEEVKT